MKVSIYIIGGFVTGGNVPNPGKFCVFNLAYLWTLWSRNLIFVVWGDGNLNIAICTKRKMAYNGHE